MWVVVRCVCGDSQRLDEWLIGIRECTRGLSLVRVCVRGGSGDVWVWSGGVYIDIRCWRVVGLFVSFTIRCCCLMIDCLSREHVDLLECSTPTLELQTFLKVALALFGSSVLTPG